MVLSIAISLGCGASSGDIDAKQKQCDAIAATIADKAVNEYGIPAQGACNNPSVTAQFAGACAQLAQCQKELADLKD